MNVKHILLFEIEKRNRIYVNTVKVSREQEAINLIQKNREHFIAWYTISDNGIKVLRDVYNKD